MDVVDNTDITIITLCPPLDIVLQISKKLQKKRKKPSGFDSKLCGRQSPSSILSELENKSVLVAF